MIDNQHVTQWLQNYVSAWKSYDPDAIRALFSENAAYRYNPFDEPMRGRETILTSWLENPDPPGSFAAEYRVIALNGNTAVSNGRTSYFQEDGETLRQQFDNIFVMQFDADGRCVDFCEWFMQART